ncbi:MAG: hypothetical protein CFH06_01103 [Alphaproteobacteria bacterium MarineAlpha3_Bin5]|nr:hypothetical protein [Magnetovibrio sp.]PPR77787.1 MAG: hypothetical protein CFH06_01103 [Alphaproteobacteria bacterium MarineAlpha3_Bin5]
MTCIFVDADACPVKNEIFRVAERHQLRVLVVSNGGLRPSQHPLVETVIVPGVPDAADQWISEQVRVGDIVITTDIPLAAKCLASGARVVAQNGEIFTEANIGNRLATRNLMEALRDADPLLKSGGKAKSFSKIDRSRFLQALEYQIISASKTKAKKHGST